MYHGARFMKLQRFSNVTMRLNKRVKFEANLNGTNVSGNCKYTHDLNVIHKLEKEVFNIVKGALYHLIL